MCNREDNFLLAQRPFDEKGPDNYPCIHLILIKGNISPLCKISWWKIWGGNGATFNHSYTRRLPCFQDSGEPGSGYSDIFEDLWLFVLTIGNQVSSARTRTSCGNCVFPFTFGGRKHTTCTTIDGDSPWCATEVDASGALVQGKYEYCTDSSCPGLNPPAINVNPNNAVGSCCE